MLKTIKEVSKNGYYYGEEVLKYVEEADLKSKAKKNRCKLDEDYFSERELEVLQLVCSQFTAIEIADKLSISRRTVEVHRNNLLLKTESKNIAGLVVYALKNKLVNLDADL